MKRCLQSKWTENFSTNCGFFYRFDDKIGFTRTQNMLVEFEKVEKVANWCICTRLNNFSPLPCRASNLNTYSHVLRYEKRCVSRARNNINEMLFITLKQHKLRLYFNKNENLRKFNNARVSFAFVNTENNNVTETNVCWIDRSA